MPSNAPSHRPCFCPPAARVGINQDEASTARFERARILAERFQLDPLLGNKEARLAAIRSRWYGLDEAP